MSISLNVNDKDIINLLGEKTVEVINAGITKRAPYISKRIGELWVTLIKQGRTYQSLVSGDLRYELGLEQPTSDMAPILETLKSSVTINFEPFKFYRGKVTGKFSVNLLTGGLIDVLREPTASYYSNDYRIDWLNWLLTYGDSIVILDHHIVFDLTPAQSSYSRTGDALMFKGGTWRVPSAFSGTANDNFLTIPVESREFQNGANKIINEELKAAF